MRRIIALFMYTFLTINVFCQVSAYDSPIETPEFVIYPEGDTFAVYHFYRLYVNEMNYALESHSTAKFSYNPNHNLTDVLLLSFGGCMMDGEELMMVDSLSGFRMKAAFDSTGNLHFTKGLAVTYGKSFSLSSDCDKQYTRFPVSKVESKWFDHASFRSQQNTKELKFGYYHSSFKKFNLLEDGRYFCCNRFPRDTISKGEWWQEGNLLVFKDDGLDEPFYACIEDRRWKIVGLSMPGAFGRNGLDYCYSYNGYDIEWSEADLNIPLIGKDFMNAMFSVDIENGSRIMVGFFGHEYSIEQVQWYDDVIPVHTISCGLYEKEDNMLHLRDSVTGICMTFELTIDTTEITYKQGFCSLMGKSFMFVDKTWHRPDFAYFFDFDEIDYPFNEYREQDSLIPCPAGIYQFRINGNFPHELILTEDGRFSYKAMDVLYLQGSVSREGNLLILKDECIEEPLYVLIEKEGLVAYLPGLFGKEKSLMRR
jgi:hypothetical protein